MRPDDFFLGVGDPQTPTLKGPEEAHLAPKNTLRGQLERHSHLRTTWRLKPPSGSGSASHGVEGLLPPLQLLDACIQVVRRLGDGFAPGKHHSVRWDATARDGSRVASGQYYYRLETEEGTISQKLLILK